MLDALFTPSETDGPSPVVIHLNGTHSQIEWQYFIGIAPQLAKRGIASIALDHPGSGSARYHLGLKYRPDPESYTIATINEVTRRSDIDAERIGVCGSSFGGIFALMATARIPRIKACVSWSPGYGFPTHRYFAHGRPSDPGPLATPYEEGRAKQQRWAYGAIDNQQLYDKMQSYSVQNDVPKINVPLLVVAGLNDPQTPAAHAERIVLEATGSPRAELLTIGPDIGGDLHCNVDNPATAVDAISDWFTDIFHTRPEGRA
nr:alpha/beta fold hydrolase [Sphingobium subterraneum]